MRPTYAQELAYIQDWINDNDRRLYENRAIILWSNERNQVSRNLQIISTGVQHEYPFYSQELLAITDKLFIASPFAYGAFSINIAVFGQLYIIIKHVRIEMINQRIWQDIHPNISKISKDLFCDGHFSAAAEIAIKEVESQMRTLFKQYNPTAALPKDAASLIGALLAETGLHKFCDTTDISGRNYRKGIQQIFEGAFSAYRNPAMHQNLSCTQREAFERITLASQMMYILSGKEAQVSQ